MKLLLLGDTHLRATPPMRRIDDFVETQLGKLLQARNIAMDNGCNLILQAGDLFDQPRQPLWLLFRVVACLRDSPPILTVYGQHDLYMRSYESFDRTAMGLLECSRVVKTLTSNPYIVMDAASPAHNCVAFYGASYGEEIPVPTTTDDYNVLVVHAPIGTEPLFPEHELIDPEGFLSENPGYKLIFCGDYHYSFERQTEHGWIINAGAMVRLSCSERDLAHKPSVVIFDTETSSWERVELSHSPAEEVFDLTTKRVEEPRVDVRNLVEALGRDQEAGVDFVTSLRLALDKLNISKGARREIESAIEQARS